MGPLHIALVVVMAVLLSADGAIIDSRRQVLPPMPGYIPVYIQHGDVPPEDPHEYAGLFQVADGNVPPRVSVTEPVITTEIAKIEEAISTVGDDVDNTTERDIIELEETTTDLAETPEDTNTAKDIHSDDSK